MRTEARRQRARNSGHSTLQPDLDEVKGHEQLNRSPGACSRGCSLGMHSAHRSPNSLPLHVAVNGVQR